MFLLYILVSWTRHNLREVRSRVKTDGLKSIDIELLFHKNLTISTGVVVHVILSKTIK